MTFEAAQRYVLGLIDERQSRRTSLGLDRMRALLRNLGDPQNAYPTLHVGGTSGKGSTATMLAGILSASGRRTGLHTKPHLRSMTERAAIDGAAIGEDRFGALLQEMMPALQRTAGEHGRPTYYETLLALAFAHFARERVDAAVIEVGLGGRLDGTNVLLPRVAAITSIGYDHTEILGDTIEAIAFEKAGIAKANVPLVLGVERPEALAVIEAHARCVGAPTILVDDATAIAVEADDARHFAVTTKRARYDVHLPMYGSFQRRNARTAIAAVEALPDDLRPPVEAVERGLASVSIPGRMEIVAGDPEIVLDIAHNEEKAEHLASALRERFSDRRLRALVAIGEGKDAHAILERLAPLVASFVVTTFAAAGRSPLPAERLAQLARRFGVPVAAVEDPAQAFALACERCARGDVLVVTGSTFLVAAVRPTAFARARRTPVHG
ncbi:MAG: bifunctional folylpolyglutamate synthase/dihydrofolate synthase [Candidatus Tyrphobacter sp.]